MAKIQVFSSRVQIQGVSSSNCFAVEPVWQQPHSQLKVLTTLELLNQTPAEAGSEIIQGCLNTHFHANYVFVFHFCGIFLMM